MLRYVLMCLKLQGILNEDGQTNLDVGYVMLDIIPIFFVSVTSFDCNFACILTRLLLRASRRA
jgi:hypothetical protein